MNAFGNYARYYDLLYRDKDYRAEVDYVVGLIRRHAPEVKSILELGCGTGLHACLMVDQGFEVTGIDMSSGMLQEANRRTAALPTGLRSRVDFALGDVRNYRHGSCFDVVVSLFHVFSYQTSNADLSAAFRTAAAHLQPGGTLIVDFWYGPAVLAQRPETRVKRLQDRDVDIVRIAEPVLHLSENVVDVNYDIRIIERETSKTHAIAETHRMRYLFLTELDLFAEHHSLRRVLSFRWMTQEPPSEDSWSVVAVFIKQ